MSYVYILQSKVDSNIYIGRTNDVSRRLAEHNSGKVQSTKSRRPLEIVKVYELATEKESVLLERELKKSYRREEIRKSIRNGGFA